MLIAIIMVLLFATFVIIAVVIQGATKFSDQSGVVLLLITELQLFDRVFTGSLVLKLMLLTGAVYR